MIKNLFLFIYIVYRYNLGKVLESLGETDSATDSMATALQVEMVSPIMQYTSIPLPFD